MPTLVRHPLAWIPIAMSLAALALLLGCAVSGSCAAGAGGDEGAAARSFQALLAGQALLVVVFAVRWLPTRPRAALAIIALQLAVAAIPVLAIVALEA